MTSCVRKHWYESAVKLSWQHFNKARRSGDLIEDKKFSTSKFLFYELKQHEGGKINDPDRMLEPIMNTLESQRVVLASSSPRRKDILKQVGLKFEVIPSKYEENLNPEDFPSPADFAIATALNKVKEVEERLRDEGESFDVLIGVDTIVYMNGRVYGKPKDEQEAFKTLKLFANNCHTVFSGVCIKTPEKTVKFSESTKVYFGDISDEVIKSYVKTGDPLDKAGGYGIQVKGGSFIEKIEGDYFNVVGLPLYSFCKHLFDLYKK